MKGRKPVIPPLGEIVDLPTSSVRIPDAPDYLEGYSKVIWERVTREMVARNIYDTDTREMVAAYCIEFARFIESEKDIRKQGATYKAKKSNSIMYNPKLTVSDRAFDRMVKLAAELGLTPVSRKRVVKVRGGASTAAASKYLKAG